MEKLGKSGCEDITEELLSLMYKISPIASFEKVGTLSGELCLCPSGLCNLPEREKEVVKESGAGLIIPPTLMLIIINLIMSM